MANSISRNDRQRQEAAELEAIRARMKARRLRMARALAARMRVEPDGTRVFVRFDARDRLQHQLLIGSFTALGFTGLMQSFSKLEFVGWVINAMLGGIETLRTIHYLAAILFVSLAIYHAAWIAYVWFVKREPGSMWPRWNDLTGLLGMIKFNLNMTKKRPAFDRFSIEEKVEYWALLWGTLIMGITGAIQWFPTLVTSFLPGVVIPVARTIHAWEAVLAVLSILTWHMYHTRVKEKNRSIFTGVMSEEEMQEGHALEYRRILAAVEFIRKANDKQEQTISRKEPAEAVHEVVELGATD